MMPKPERRLWVFTRRLPFLLILLSVTLVGLLVWISLGVLMRGGASHNTDKTTPQTLSTPTATQGMPVDGPSPLLFGTNLGLFNANDQILRSAPTRNLLQQMHPGIIRMPIRSKLSEAVTIHTAQIIKDLGAIPLVVLHSVNGPHVLDDDIRVIKDMNTIFGKSIVYYEFGNEDDWTGINAATYTQAWNRLIPQLKQAALHGQFVGPVNYQYNGDFLSAFLQQANPHPDQVSWHEYTCSYKWPDADCIANIDNWTTHIQDSRYRMTAILGAPLPIMITEWNYAPDAAYNDGKNNDRTFMTTWTNKALQTLADSHVFAAMQYTCTNTAMSLIDNDNKPTLQGTIFQHLYLKMILNGHQPTPTPDPTPSIVLNGSQVFSFEDGGTDGWTGQGIVKVQNSTAFALDGTHALQVTLSITSSSNFPYIAVNLANMPSYPRAGQTLTAYVYLPASITKVSITAKLFIVDSNYHWFSKNTVQLSPGTWIPLTYLLPPTINGQPAQLGIQFNSTISSTTISDMYIDAVGWS